MRPLPFPNGCHGCHWGSMHIRSTSTCAGRKWLCLIHTFCKLRCKLWLRSVQTHCQFLGRFEFLVRDYVELASGKMTAQRNVCTAQYVYMTLHSVLLLQLLMKSIKTELHHIIQDIVPTCEPLANRRISTLFASPGRMILIYGCLFCPVSCIRYTSCLSFVNLNLVKLRRQLTTYCN